MMNNNLFVVNFRKFLVQKLCELRRLPKIIDYLWSVIILFDNWYIGFGGARERNARRLMCDGSIIALKQLIMIEFDVIINIIDGDGSDVDTVLGTKKENASLTYIGLKGESPLYLGLKSETLEFDYTVEVKSVIPEDIRFETLKRIYATVANYNSAGYFFNITYNP